jgi:hypothetical protein
MVITILATNVITILTLNFKWIQKTENPLLFPTVLLYRDIIIPLLVLVFINVFHTSQKKSLSFIFILICLNGIEALLVFLNIFEYTKWNFFYATIVHSAYLFIGLGIAKTVLFVSKRSLKQ